MRDRAAIRQSRASDSPAIPGAGPIRRTTPRYRFDKPSVAIHATAVGAPEDCGRVPASDVSTTKTARRSPMPRAGAIRHSDRKQPAADERELIVTLCEAPQPGAPRSKATFPPGPRASAASMRRCDDSLALATSLWGGGGVDAGAEHPCCRLRIRLRSWRNEYSIVNDVETDPSLDMSRIRPCPGRPLSPICHSKPGVIRRVINPSSSSTPECRGGDRWQLLLLLLL